ncbi:enolase C-terminal domain-like protein [Marinivivus vitaminiproducens]|uniref:enolase C-terminal domain-like protein n=1 Tax=Marinivivus vitaminiproducens TaxID=3035935 RepID=UPI00279B6060|nr:enolase C-terminal domain-like protein [Geminicoccaceae bacterium SCSIO 64248]
MPRITDVRVTPIAFRDPPLLNAMGIHEPYALRSIIEVDVEGGVTGLGESYGDERFLHPMQAIAPRLKGMEVLDVNGLRRVVAEVAKDKPEADNPFFRRGNERIEARLVGAFEVAMMDAFGKGTDTRLCDLLGGAVRQSVPFSAYLFFKKGRHIDRPDLEDEWGEVITPEQLVGEAKRMCGAYGFGSIKLKAGAFPPEQEIEALEAVGEAFPGTPLRIDPNGNWHVHTTIRLLPRLEPLLEYLEDPTFSIPAMGLIQNATSLPLATNMCTVAFAHFPETIRLGAVRIVLADHHYWGGLRATADLARICDTWGLGLSMHSNSHMGISLMAMTHAAAATPNLTYACDTHYPWQTEEVIEGGRVRFEQGSVTLPDGPGLGVTLDKDALARLHEQYTTCGIRKRDDGHQMQKYEPGWSPIRPRY